MELTEPLRSLLREGAAELRGRARRIFMARAVLMLGPGGQRRAERELGWSRVTIRKGLRELATGTATAEPATRRGRLRAEARLPELLNDIRAIVEPQGHSASSGDERRSRLSAAEVRRRLVAERGYADAELPTVQTIAAKLKLLGYYPPPPRRTHDAAPLPAPSGENTLSQSPIPPASASSPGRSPRPGVPTSTNYAASTTW